MKVVFDAFTRERLEGFLDGRPGHFKLFYDVVDCGCNGMLVLLLVDRPNPTDRPIESEHFSFVVDNRQESQFDDVMALEADPGFPTFKVKSDGSLFGNNVKLRDVRAKSE